MQTTHRATRCFAIAIVLAALSTGCTQNSAPSTPAVPTPPQLQAANAVNALAQSLDAAITGLRSARDQGKIGAADVANAEKVAGIIALAGKQIDAELRSADPWPTQKTAILKIITASGLQGALANVSSTAQGYIAAAVALFNQVSSAVGGPNL
jgi:hypothetical protein